MCFPHTHKGKTQIVFAYYSDLCTSLNLSKEKIDRLVITLNFPSPAIDALETLKTPIILGEIVNAICSLETNKAPGPDGFTADFYILFKSSRKLLKAFSCCLEIN